MDFVEAGIIAMPFGMIARFHAVETKAARQANDRFIATKDHPAIAVTPKHLGRVERKRGCIAKAA
jgi:hypothetical protein